MNIFNKYINRRILFTIFIILFTSNLFAQDGNIGAIVIQTIRSTNDTFSKQIMIVSYTSENSKQTFIDTINNVTGKNELFYLAPDRYKVTITSNSYQEIEIKKLIIRIHQVSFLKVELKLKRNKKDKRKIKIKTIEVID